MVDGEGYFIAYGVQLRQRSKRKEHHCLNPWYRG